jgi:cation diffusion facilitator family transporter
MEKNNAQLAVKVSIVTIFWNILLSAFKLLAGVLGHSAAMISDAVHSLSDVLSTFIVIIGMKVANKEADKEHPYGHERFECVAAIILAAILCATGVGIGYGGIKTITSGGYQKLMIPGTIALVAAVISIIVKEGMFWYTRAAATKLNSGALFADAWHHRSDALSSVGSFIGIFGAQLGFPILDPLASLAICFFIVKAAFDIFRDAIDKMTDHSCDDSTLERIRSLILAQEMVYGIDLLQVRLFGNKMYVDVEINTDGNMSLYQSHEVAHIVHDCIEHQFCNVKHCMVHVNPEKYLNSITIQNIED